MANCLPRMREDTAEHRMVRAMRIQSTLRKGQGATPILNCKTKWSEHCGTAMKAAYVLGVQPPGGFGQLGNGADEIPVGRRPARVPTRVSCLTMLIAN
jgi:hypothetical protein